MISVKGERDEQKGNDEKIREDRFQARTNHKPHDI